MLTCQTVVAICLSGHVRDDFPREALHLRYEFTFLSKLYLDSYKNYGIRRVQFFANGKLSTIEVAANLVQCVFEQ